MRASLLICLLPIFTPAVALATDKPAQPVTPLVAAPAFLDVVTFEYRADDETHKITVNMGPNLLRVDENSDGYSVIYNPLTGHYTGLEHRNYTWWDFRGPRSATPSRIPSATKPVSRT